MRERGSRSFVVRLHELKELNNEGVGRVPAITESPIEVKLQRDPRSKILQIIFPNGSRIEVKKSPRRPSEMSDNEYTALLTSKLAMNDAFPDERQGVDQTGFIVREEDEIKFLPKSRETSADEALNWACATLQSCGWDANRIAQYWINNTSEVQTMQAFGQLSPERKLALIKQLKNVLIGHFPANASKIGKIK